MARSPAIDLVLAFRGCALRVGETLLDATRGAVAPGSIDSPRVCHCPGSSGCWWFDLLHALALALIALAAVILRAVRFGYAAVVPRLRCRRYTVALVSEVAAWRRDSGVSMPLCDVAFGGFDDLK